LTFSLRTRPQHPSSLFPYTTLFRSEEPPAPLVTDHEVPAWQRELLERVGGVDSTSFRGAYPFAEIEYEFDGPVTVSMQAFTPFVDRKSTRLNSSHVKISYAVFCLKK